MEQNEIFLSFFSVILDADASSIIPKIAMKVWIIKYKEMFAQLFMLVTYNTTL